jgi:hypothetical protein
MYKCIVFHIFKIMYGMQKHILSGAELDFRYSLEYLLKMVPADTKLGL